MGAAGAVSAVPSGSFLKSGPHLRGSQLSREPDPATFLEVQLVQGDWFRLGSRDPGGERRGTWAYESSKSLQHSLVSSAWERGVWAEGLSDELSTAPAGDRQGRRQQPEVLGEAPQRWCVGEACCCQLGLR